MLIFYVCSLQDSRSNEKLYHSEGHLHLFGKHLCILILVKTSEFLRWLKKNGATIDAAKGKGSHIKVILNGKQTVVPGHSKELKTGTVAAIKKQLGLKEDGNA